MRINSLVDIYDGNYSYAIFRVSKQIVFHGMGKLINKASYGVTDNALLELHSTFYEEVIQSIIQTKTFPKFNSIEFKH